MNQQDTTEMSGAITAQHGWGYDWRTFESWCEYLPETWQLQLKNRGYFNESNDRIFNSHTDLSPLHKRILVCHSFGLHLLDQEAIDKADHIVIISSFANFHVNDNSQSKKAVRKMIMRLNSEPVEVLSDFYSACTGESSKPTVEAISALAKRCNLELMIDDLKTLNEINLAAEKFSKAKSILILHGTKDAIVNVAAADELHSLLPGSTLMLNEDAGHALPISHSQWCLEQIFEVIA